MKYFNSLVVATIIIFSATIVNASNIKNAFYNATNDLLSDYRIETIDEHAFFIFNYRNAGIEINYGDKVELVFGFNNTITIYNISASDNKIFTNKNEFVAFIDPEYLRCFSTRKLKKIIIYSGNEALVIKTNITANQSDGYWMKIK